LLLPAFFFCGVAPVSAAEVLQVSGPDLLLIGDRNRTSMVRLGCMTVTPGSEAAAQAWLRLRLPRRTRVNLRPLTESEEGVLVARVSSLERDTGDLADGLVSAGLASPLPCG
jgi:endonuclease YncB( thermonuclease family)